MNPNQQIYRTNQSVTRHKSKEKKKLRCFVHMEKKAISYVYKIYWIYNLIRAVFFQNLNV